MDISAYRRLKVFLIHLLLVTVSISTASATIHHGVRARHSHPLNTSISLPEARRQPPIPWRLSSTHSLTFTSYTPATPERDYFAALLTLQTSIFSAYVTAPSFWIDKDVIEQNVYGINIDISNADKELTYALVSEMLGAVGGFLQQKRVCKAGWYLSVFEEGRTERVLSSGVIGEARFMDGSVVGGAGNRSEMA